MVDTHVTTSARPGPRIDDESEPSTELRQDHVGAGGPVLTPPGDRNEVHLIGRLAAPVESRTLPSGAVMAIFRVIVRRPPAQTPPATVRVPTVDVIDCVAWTEPLRESVAGFRTGDMLEVEGGLRRRFWRSTASGGSGPVSRYEIELTSVSRLGPSS